MVLACEEFERGLKAADLTGKVAFDTYKRKAQQKLDTVVLSPSLTVLAQQSRLKKKNDSKIESKAEKIATMSAPAKILFMRRLNSMSRIQLPSLARSCVARSSRRPAQYAVMELRLATASQVVARNNVVRRSFIFTAFELWDNMSDLREESFCRIRVWFPKEE
jgi:hypothetical protein